MSDWLGLRYWNTPHHRNNAITMWKHDSIEDFKKMTMHEMKWTYESRASGVMRYTDQYEREKSLEAIKNGYTNYADQDFEYIINEAGFRGPWQLGDNTSPALGVFGCSFTFGVGLPDYDSYPYLIGNNLGCQVYNFGVPGGSMNRATRYYSLASSYQKFDYVIFLVPHIGRMEVPRMFGDHVSCMNVIPNWESSDKTEEVKRKEIYKALDDDYFEYDTLRNVMQCVTLAKANNTKIYFSSWDMPTYDLIYDYLGADSGMMLPWFEVLEFQKGTRSNLARDGAHPGPMSHATFAQRSMVYLK